MLSSQHENLTTQSTRRVAVASDIDLTLLRRFRDEVLLKTTRGKSITDRFYQNSLELLHHLAADSDLRAAAIQGIVSLQPVMQGMLTESGTQPMALNQIDPFNTFIQKLDAVAGVQLKSAIDGELARVGPLTNLAGSTSLQVRQKALGLPLQITHAGINLSGAFEFILLSELGQTNRVQWSLDLQQWNDLTSVFSATTATNLVDPAAVGSTRRFYRVVSP